MKRRTLGPWEARPFGVFLIRELLRHVEDCKVICRDLRNLDELWPGTLSPELLQWTSELESMLLELDGRIPGGPERYRMWIEV